MPLLQLSLLGELSYKFTAAVIVVVQKVKDKCKDVRFIYANLLVWYLEFSVQRRALTLMEAEQSEKWGGGIGEICFF